MTSTDLVPIGEHGLFVNERDRERSILLMDSHDLEQAMAEVRGEVLASFVYVPKGAKPQLTYAGIKEAARLYRNVHFGATAVPLPDGTWMITSYAHNLADNTRVDYPMPYPAFDPANQEQAIKFRANLSKSLRNALAAVLPVAYLQTMIERWMEQKSGATGPRAAGLPSRPNQVEGEALPTAGRSGPTDGSLPPTPTPTSRSSGSLPPARVTPAASPSTGSTVTTAVRPPASEQPAPAPEPRSAAEWTREQLGTYIREACDLPLKSGQDWANLARIHGQPVPTSREAMTQDWLLALYQAVRASTYAVAIPAAAREEDVTALVAEALGDVDRRHITMEQYHSLREAGEARKAELASPLLAGAPLEAAS